jgi:Spy/CpxP family protein refolding chaperone
MLKRCAITLVVALFAIGACAFAQQENQNPPSGQDNQGQQQGRRGGWGPRDPAQMVQRLTQDLNLTADQQVKILPILQDQQKQMQAMRDSNPPLSQDDRRAKFMELRKSTNTQIRAVLTEDQQKKFDEIQQKREQEMGQRRDNPQGDQSPKTDSQPKAEPK